MKVTFFTSFSRCISFISNILFKISGSFFEFGKSIRLIFNQQEQESIPILFHDKSKTIYCTISYYLSFILMTLKCPGSYSDSKCKSPQNSPKSCGRYSRPNDNPTVPICHFDQLKIGHFRISSANRANLIVTNPKWPISKGKNKWANSGSPSWN